MFRKIKPTTNQAIVFYKLLHDALFLMLLFFVFSMIAEGILPGIISGRVQLFVPAIAVLANIFLISAMAKKYGFPPSKKANQKSALALSGLILLLIFNVIWKLNFPAAPMIIIISAAAIYFFYSMIFPENS